MPETQESSSPRQGLREQELKLLQVQAQAIEELDRRFASSFETFIQNVDSELPLDYWHIEKIVSVLDRVERGELKRLMVFLPPGCYKSTLVSRLFAAYFLRKNPRKRFILASYSSDLANTMSRKARENYEKTGALLSQESSAVHAWDTLEGGGFYSLGIGSTITGKRGHILALDDYMKSKEEAYSISFRDMQWDWWKWVWYQRKERDGVFIIICTRWNLDDLVGRLLLQEKIAPEYWHIINLQGRREAATLMEFPETCTVEADPRREGEPLCPEIHSSEQLDREKALDSAMFAAMFQQNPVQESGEIWKRESFRIIPDYQMDDLMLSVKDYGLCWDTAYTENEANSASAKVGGGVGPDGNIYINEAQYRYLEFPELVEWMLEHTGPHYIEQKASGKSAAQTLQKSGIFAEEVPVKGGDKIARAKLASVLVSQGRVFVRASLLGMLLDDPKQGLIRFPAAGGDDVNDAFVQMLNRLWPYTLKEQKSKTAKEIWDEQVAAGARGEDLRKWKSPNEAGKGTATFDPPRGDWRYDIL